MNTVTFRTEKRTIERSLPEGWDEMGQDEALDAIQTLYRYTPTYARTRIAHRLLGLPKKISMRIHPEQMYDIVQTLSWMDVDEYLKPPADRFTFNGTTYYLPKEKLLNASCIEYALADEALTSYMESRSDRDLYLLAAILCREAKKSPLKIRQTGDVRIPLLNREEANFRAEIFAGLDRHILAMVLLYFIGCRRHVHGIYADWIFTSPEPHSEEEDEEEDEPVPAGGPMFGWWTVFMDVAKSGVFGNIRQVHQANFHELCMHLVQEKKYYLEEKARMDRMRAKSRAS